MGKMKFMAHTQITHAYVQSFRDVHKRQANAACNVLVVVAGGDAAAVGYVQLIYLTDSWKRR